LPSIRDSFHMLHEPHDPGDIDPQAPARRRLAYDEFLAGQLSLSLVRQRLRKVAGQPVTATGAISSKILKTLPFSLTSSQTEAIAEVLKD
ncbi:ATP-dependent DNA helicase RecG, partial [Rhizobium ruizarguesonis]